MLGEHQPPVIGLELHQDVVDPRCYRSLQILISPDTTLLRTRPVANGQHLHIEVESSVEPDLLEQVRSALGTKDLRPLTSGGQKLVFEAELEDAPCVVKVVQVPENEFANEVLERARREVELLFAIESDHVVRVLSEAVEVGDRPEVICWIEEQLDGQDLSALVGTSTWDAAEVSLLLHDGAQGLTAFHELDVVHRDLSPGNVRKRSDGRFVLMDPGFARHLTKTALTGVYQPGTHGFCSPEHVPGGSPIMASDVFGLGVLAFFALTGELPVPWTGDETAYWDALRNVQAVEVGTIRTDVPEALAEVVDRCLQRQPARRYLDAAELLDGLAAGGLTS